jgi:hypothetical protein
MRKLESMITEFVGELLRTIGEANIDELQELFAGAPQGDGALKVPTGPVSFKLPSIPSSPPLHAVPGPGRRRGTSRRTFLPLSSLPPLSPPPGVAEITDPESLLSLGGGEPPSSNGVASPHLSNGASEGAARAFVEPRRSSRSRAPALLEVSENATPAQGHGEHDGESPASGVRALGSGSTIKLSDNETLARVSNSGVVIRRKKRA